jgi:hypothetical protein
MSPLNRATRLLIDAQIAINFRLAQARAAFHMQPLTSQASAGYSGRDAPLGDARTKWQKEARNQDVSNHPTLQVLTHAHTHALTPSFSGGPRSVQEHRRYANSPSGRATCRVARMPKSFNRSPPLGRQLQTPPVSSKAQQRTAGVRRATDSPTERRGRGRRAQRAGMRFGNHLDSTKCVGIRSVGCSCRPPQAGR